MECWSVGVLRQVRIAPRVRGVRDAEGAQDTGSTIPLRTYWIRCRSPEAHPLSIRMLPLTNSMGSGNSGSMYAPATPWQMPKIGTSESGRDGDQQSRDESFLRYVISTNRVEV